MHLMMEIELGVPIEFNYAMKVLRENLHDYDISKAKLVSSYIITTYSVVNKEPHHCMNCHVVLFFADLDSFLPQSGFLSSTKNTGFCVASTWYTTVVIYLTQTTGRRKISSSSITK
jgi:hypothetical protein